MSHTAHIVSTGAYLPSREVTNEELAQRLIRGSEPGAAREDGPTPDGLREIIARLEQSTGIRRRFYAPDQWATSDLALPAARQALERAGRTAAEVDLLIVCTDTPDYPTPATSTVLQHKLGARHAGTFDLGCACASFATGLTTAAGWIACVPRVRTVLVVGVYMMQRLAADDDPALFFYGDGAGAFVLEGRDPEPGRKPAPGLVHAVAWADGSHAERWGIFAGGTAEPASVEAVVAGRTRVRSLEPYPSDVNRRGWPRLVRRLSSEGGFALDELDLVIFSQVRKPTIEEVMADLGLPLERTHTIMETHGYTGSACLPMAFDDAVRRGRVRAGSLVAFVGSGVGYNQAGAVFRLGPVPA